MKLFKIIRLEEGSWGDTKEVVVLADDPKRAERKARTAFDDLKKVKLKVEPIEPSEEKIIAFQSISEHETYFPQKS